MRRAWAAMACLQQVVLMGLLHGSLSGHSGHMATGARSLYGQLHVCSAVSTRTAEHQPMLAAALAALAACTRQQAPQALPYS